MPEELNNAMPVAEDAQAQPTMEQLSEMLFGDLQGEVSGQSVENAAVNTMPEENPMQPTIDGEVVAAESEPVVTVEETFAVEQPKPITLDDLKATESDILAKVLNAVNAQSSIATNETPQEPIAQEAHDEAVNEVVLDKEAFLDKFYDDPEGAVKEYADKIAESKVKAQMGNLMKELNPLLEQSKAIQASENARSIISDFIDGTPDAENFIDEIAAYIRGNNLPLEDANSYMTAYRESKIAKLGQENEALKASQGRSLADYLQDEASIGEMAQNQALKDLVIKNYLQGLQAGDKPATIQSGGSTQPMAEGANNPKTLKDAGDLLKQQLFR